MDPVHYQEHVMDYSCSICSDYTYGEPSDSHTPTTFKSLPTSYYVLFPSKDPVRNRRCIGNIWTDSSSIQLSVAQLLPPSGI